MKILLSILVIMVSTLVPNISGLQCWQCPLLGNTCRNSSDTGQLVECDSQFTSCFKSETSAKDAVIVRKCGSVNTGSSCLESTIPSNEVFIAAWVCHCQTDGCNGVMDTNHLDINLVKLLWIVNIKVVIRYFL